MADVEYMDYLIACHSKKKYDVANSHWKGIQADLVLRLHRINPH